MADPRIDGAMQAEHKSEEGLRGRPSEPLAVKEAFRSDLPSDHSMAET